MFSLDWEDTKNSFTFKGKFKRKQIENPFQILKITQVLGNRRKRQAGLETKAGIRAGQTLTLIC